MTTTPHTEEEKIVSMIQDKSEVINPHLWYVNPEVLQDALAYFHRDLLEKIEGEIGSDWCEFEPDGEKHSCISDCDGMVENCRKCHKDRCSNKDCPLGKGEKPELIKLINQERSRFRAIINKYKQ